MTAIGTGEPGVIDQAGTFNITVCRADGSHCTSKRAKVK